MIKIFKVSKKSKSLEKIDEKTPKPELFADEAGMRDFFATGDNLNKIFPSLCYLTKEPIINPGNRLDTIAYNPNEKSFAIIEYKLESKSSLEQIRRYMGEISSSRSSSEKGKLMHEAILGYYAPNGGRGSTDTNYYNWRKLKVILINSSYLTGEEKWTDWEENISLVKLGYYKLEGKDHLYIETNDKELLEETKKVKKLPSRRVTQAKEKNISLPIKNIARDNDLTQFLLERGAQAQVKEWISEMNNFLKSKYAINIELFSRFIKYSANGIPVLTSCPRKNHFFVYLNKLTNNNFSLKLIKKYQLQDYKNKGHNGNLGNDWQYTINNDNSFQQLFDLLTSYLEKVNAD